MRNGKFLLIPVGSLTVMFVSWVAGIAKSNNFFDIPHWSNVLMFFSSLVFVISAPLMATFHFPEKKALLSILWLLSFAFIGILIAMALGY